MRLSRERPSARACFGRLLMPAEWQGSMSSRYSTASSSADLTRDVTQLIKEAAARAQKISDDHDRDTANGTRAARQSV